MLKKVFHILEQYLKPGDTVVVGVSGGPDSMMLFHMLMKFRKRFASLHVVVAHINHGLRGKESEKDENLVKKMAEHYGVPFKSKKLSLHGKSHIEIRGREERRKFFEILRKKYNAKWVLLGHHRDDAVESIVLHFLRGSGPRGLSGMEIARNGYLRPLLPFSKKEIFAYAKRQKIPYRIDVTNKENRFRRNLLRNKIFPLFMKINPAFQEVILRNAELFREIDEWLRNEAETFLKSQKMRRAKGLFSTKDFQKLPRPVQKTVVQVAYQKLKNQAPHLPSVRVSEVLRLIERNRGKKQIILGKPGKGRFLLEKSVFSYRP